MRIQTNNCGGSGGSLRAYWSTCRQISFLISCWLFGCHVAIAQDSNIATRTTSPTTNVNQLRTESNIDVPAALAGFPLPKNAPENIATPEIVEWLEKMIRANLPEDYEDDRKWNRQKEVWDGIKLRREGLKIETKRKKKLVNAGTWTRYRIAIVEPEKNLWIQFNRLETLDDGRIAFAVTVDCALDVFGRLSQWARDVQLFSISANADAACRLTLEGTVEFQLNFLKLPPDIGIRPKVDTAHVDLTYYRVRRISQVGGDFAKVLGKGLRSVLDEKLEDLNGKLVDKINKQLDKHSDKLSFSTQDWLRAKMPLPAASKQ